MTNRRLRLLMALASAAPLTVVLGCGLISSDIATVSFDLPPKTYSFDTSQAGWKGATSSAFATVPAIPCAADADCCAPAIAAAGIDCSTLICDAPTQACAFAVTVESPPQTIDLKQEAPELSSFGNQSVLDISVSKLSYDVNQNTLNVDLPPVDLFLAPQGTTSTADPAAVRFATVPAIAHGVTLTGGDIPLEPAATTAFENIGMHFGTPFVFLARTRVVVPGGTPAPMGALTLTVRGRLSAKPNL